IDAAISNEVLRVLKPLGIEAALKAIEAQSSATSPPERQLKLSLQQPRYEAAYACRQYDAVDPANRLVAGELERRWNEALQVVHRIEGEIAALEARKPAPLGEKERRHLDPRTDNPALAGHSAHSRSDHRSAQLFFFGMVGAVLLARVAGRIWQRRHGLVRIGYPDGRIVEVTPGTSVLEASRLAGIPHASVCGGRGRCSTCRIRVRGEMHSMDPPAEDEQLVLRRIRATSNVRLACQLRPRGAGEVTPLLPPFAHAADGRRR